MIKDVIKTFNTKTNNNYKYDLDHFLDYMSKRRNWSGDDMLFNGISTIDIIDSLEYNINHVPYTSESIAKKYCVAISEFFLYAIKEGYITNTDFYNELVEKTTDVNSFYAKTNTYIESNPKLEKPSENKSFTKMEIEQLILYCNSYLENKKYTMNFNERGSCICIKLMILLGLKYNVACKIGFNDFDGNVLFLNEYKIHLPNMLKKQLIDYQKDVKEKFNPIPEYMFIRNDGKSWGNKTRGGALSYTIEKVLGYHSTTGISKFGISNLLDVGISDNAIMRITGAKQKYLQDCINEKTDINKEKYLNSRLSKIDYFYTL